VLADLASGLAEALGDDLLGLYSHGSLVSGDFAPARSDIDVLAVVARPPDEAMLTAVAPVHASLESRHPAWRGRIEVETVALSTIAVLASDASFSPAGDGDGHEMDAIMRVSPGEALHLLPATSHRIVTWSTVRRTGRRLAGPDASEALPAMSEAVVRAALLDHVRDWPSWVEGMTSVGAQSYSVLSMCRAWCALVDGEQLSKRAAADRFTEDHGDQDGDLVRWARDWWYADGSDAEQSRHEQVRDFVVRTSRTVLGASVDSASVFKKP
jgi:hypothetical protein